MSYNLRAEYKTNLIKYIKLADIPDENNTVLDRLVSLYDSVDNVTKDNVERIAINAVLFLLSTRYFDNDEEDFALRGIFTFICDDLISNTNPDTYYRIAKKLNEGCVVNHEDLDKAICETVLKLIAERKPLLN